jgi:predicted naringenin-chalcone synthase
MIKLIAVAAVALAVATSAQAMSPAPLHQPDGMTTQVAYGCGAGRTRVGGVCLARTTKRQVRRCAVWGVGCGERLPSMALRRQFWRAAHRPLLISL